MEHIINAVLKSNDLNYGYYGSNAFFLKRWLWWNRLKLANKLYSKHSSHIGTTTLLDFGCAFGFFSAYLSKKFKFVYLIELNKKYLNQGVKIHDKFGNNNYLGITNSKNNPTFFINKISKKINLFLFFDVLEHIKNIDIFIAKLRKISAPNAFLLISLPTENFLYMWLTKFKKEKDHCNRYFEIESILNKHEYDLIEKKTLFSLFNIYLYKS